MIKLEIYIKLRYQISFLFINVDVQFMGSVNL